MIWECFYGDGRSVIYLRELGFEVIHENVDFFHNDLGDILVSNPPYSMKKEVFTRLKEARQTVRDAGPDDDAAHEVLQELFVDDRIQVILPHKKRHFTSNKKTLKKSRCAFYTCYVCYKLSR